MRFVIFLIIVGGIFWAIDKGAYDGHYTQMVERIAEHLAKTTASDIRNVVDRLVGKT